eukprot:6192331-Pleurochrysis_carterae.AAC.1
MSWVIRTMSWVIRTMSWVIRTMSWGASCPSSAAFAQVERERHSLKWSERGIRLSRKGESGKRGGGRSAGSNAQTPLMVGGHE